MWEYLTRGCGSYDSLLEACEIGHIVLWVAKFAGMCAVVAALVFLVWFIRRQQD